MLWKDEVAKMNFGFTQIIILILIGVLLFGNLPKRAEELIKAAKLIRKETKGEDALGKKFTKKRVRGRS